MTRAKKATDVPVHIYLGRAMSAAEPHVTRGMIAEALGYSSPGVVSMMKTGGMKIPVNKVAKLADTLGIDRVDLLRRVMLAYRPDEWAAIEEIMGEHLMTRRERAFLAAVRKLVGTNDVDFVADVDFMRELKPMLEALADRDVKRELGEAMPPATKRGLSSELYQLNQDMEQLMLRQAKERIELREKYTAAGGRAFVGDSDPAPASA